MEQGAARSRFFPFQLSAKEQHGHGLHTAHRGGAASPPGTCPKSLIITGSRWAVSSLIESPWGEGAAETVKYSEGNTVTPSQKQKALTPHVHARLYGGQKKLLAGPH